MTHKEFPGSHKTLCSENALSEYKLYTSVGDDDLWYVGSLLCCRFNVAATHQVCAIPRIQQVQNNSEVFKQCFFLTPLYWRSALHQPAHVLTLPSVLAAATPGINVEDRCGSRVHTDALAGCDMGRNNSTPFSESAHHTPSTSLPPCRMFLPCWCCTSHQDHTSSLGT